MVTVQVSEDLRHLRPQDAQQWQLELLDDRDVVARFPTGGRRLQSDPAGTDDDNTAAIAGECFLDAVAVLQPAKEQHTVELPAGHRESPRPRTGGEQQLPVRQRFAVAQEDLVPSHVKRGGHPSRSSTPWSSYQDWSWTNTEPRSSFPSR